MGAQRTREQINRNMRSVRSAGSQVEVALGRALWHAGLRYRKQFAIAGRPDYVLTRSRIAIFCDSHFWHGYDWERRKHDHKHNTGFWHAKIERNMERDREVNELLTSQGWLVFRFWEHQVTCELESCVETVVSAHRIRIEQGCHDRGH